MGTPLATLINIGKFFGVCGMALFLFLSIIGQALYWFRGFKQGPSGWPKQHKWLVKAAEWECWILGGLGATYVGLALVALLWQVISRAW